jgi:hypothetical protein
MLSENTYCPLTRALGMIYSLVLCGIEDVELVTATDGQCEEHHLVLVDDKVLNYWPNTVKDNKISDFTIIRRISIDPVMNKIK